MSMKLQCFPALRARACARNFDAFPEKYVTAQRQITETTTALH